MPQTKLERLTCTVRFFLDYDPAVEFIENFREILKDEDDGQSRFRKVQGLLKKQERLASKLKIELRPDDSISIDCADGSCYGESVFAAGPRDFLWPEREQSRFIKW